MERYNGYRITDTLNDGNLWASDTEGIDMAASEARYFQLLSDALHERYPGVAVFIKVNRNTVGYEDGLHLIAPDGSEQDDERPFLDAIVQRVYEDGAWYVELTP